MATKKTMRQAPMVDQMDDDPGIVELDAGVTELLIQLGDTPDDAKVHLYRVRTGIRPPFAFLDEMTAGDFNIADVKARYGGGEFLVRVWQRGVPGFKINQRFSIEGAPRIADSAPPTVQLPPVSPGGSPIIVPQGDSGMAMAAMMRAMQDGFGQMAAAIQSTQQRGGGIEETLRLVALVKQVLGPANSNPLEIMRDVMGIVREAQPLTGEGGKADGWSLLQTMAERVLPAIIERSASAPNAPEHEMIENPAMLAAMPMPTPTPTPTPMPMQQPQPQPQPEQRTMPNGAPPHIRNAFALLAGAAEHDGDPATYANLVLDNTDDATVHAFVNRPDWFAQVCALAPKAAQQREWWERLRALLVEALAEPADDAPESPESAHYSGGSPMQ